MSRYRQDDRQAQDDRKDAGRSNGKEGPVMSFGPFFAGTCTFKVAVWPNEREGKNGTFVTYNLTVQRSFKDRNDKWVNQDLPVFTTEVPVLLFALTQAWEAIQNEMAKK